MQKLFLLIASLLGALSVAIGAFGAHGLKNYLTGIGRLDVFETAVKYQFYHVFALLVTALLIYKIENKCCSCWLVSLHIRSTNLYRYRIYFHDRFASISEKINTSQRIKVCDAKDIDVLVTELDPEDALFQPYKEVGIAVV